MQAKALQMNKRRREWLKRKHEETPDIYEPPKKRRRNNNESENVIEQFQSLQSQKQRALLEVKQKYEQERKALADEYNSKLSKLKQKISQHQFEESNVCSRCVADLIECSNCDEPFCDTCNFIEKCSDSNCDEIYCSTCMRDAIMHCCDKAFCFDSDTQNECCYRAHRDNECLKQCHGHCNCADCLINCSCC